MLGARLADGTPGARITVGMPVFNGARFLARAIESILAQSLTDLRLIVLDNASTDNTAEIVGSYIASDSRVSYERNRHNLGAAPNFNNVFGMSSSEYFKWAACDDELAPNYLEKCVAALDQDPSASLAHSWVREFDATGHTIREYAPLPPGVSADDRRQRFRARALYRGWCTEIFGVIRVDRLRQSGLIRSFAAADLALIIELCLMGRIVVVEEPLFYHRIHEAQFTKAIFERRKGLWRKNVSEWYDTGPDDQKTTAFWLKFFLYFFKIIFRHVPSRLERTMLYPTALRWLLQRNCAIDVAQDVIHLLRNATAPLDRLPLGGAAEQRARPALHAPTASAKGRIALTGHVARSASSGRSRRPEDKPF